MNAKNPQIGARPGLGMPTPDKVLEAAKTAQREKENTQNGNPDFANGKGDDPRARGAESQMDFIMSGK